MICPNCGKTLRDGSKFCGYCGVKIEMPGEPTREKNETEASQNQPEEESYETNGEKKRASGRVRPRAVLIPVVILAAAAVVVILLMKTGVLFSPAYTGEYDGFAEAGEESLVTDEETGITYVDDTLLIFVDHTASDEDKTEIVESIDGKAIGEIQGSTLDVIQVQVSADSLSDLEELAEETGKQDDVYYAIYDFEVDSGIPYEELFESLFAEYDWLEDLFQSLYEWGEYTIAMFDDLFGTGEYEPDTDSNAEAEGEEATEEEGEETEEGEAYLLSEILVTLCEEGYF